MQHGALCNDSYEKTSVMRGHHIYKSIWTPIIGEELVPEAREDNGHDKHTFAVMKDGCIVEHVFSTDSTTFNLKDMSQNFPYAMSRQYCSYRVVERLHMASDCNLCALASI